MTKQEEFNDAVKRNRIKIVKLLIKDKNVDPSYCSNSAICNSFYRGYTDIIDFLIKDSRVKNTLKNDNLEIYNNLLKFVVQNKIGEF